MGEYLQEYPDKMVTQEVHFHKHPWSDLENE